MENYFSSEFNCNVIRILKGSAIAIVLSIVLLLIFAFVLTYTSIQDNTIKPVIMVISGVSILLGSSISTLKIKKNGMLNGGLVGLIYITTMYLLSAIAGAGFGMNMYSIIMIAVTLIMGIVGGILGINLR